MENREAYQKIAKLNLVSSTPISLGGYDTLPTRMLEDKELPEPLRTQSIKGAARWWSRAVLAGVFYSAGFHDNALIKETINYSGKVWGSSSKGISGIKIQTHLTSIHKLNRLELTKLSSHSRITLLGLGSRRRPQDMFRRLTGSITIERATWSQLPQQGWLFATYSIVISLILGCLGKGSRRGLGCFDISNADCSPSLRDAIDKAQSGMPEAILKSVIELARGFTGEYGYKRSIGLPPIPAIYRDIFKLYRCKIQQGTALDVSIRFSRCTTRPYDLAQKKLAWILGLPRSQRGTGYFPKDSMVERRASPIILAAHNNWAYISVFYSSDWPRTLIWRGRYENEIKVDDDDIRDAIDIAVNSIMRCLEKSGINCEEVNIW